MLEGVRRVDHWDRMKDALPPDEARFLPGAAGRPRKALEAITPVIERVQALIDGHRTLDDVVRASGLGRFPTSDAVYELISAGMIHARESPKSAAPAETQELAEDAKVAVEGRSEPRIVCWRQVKVGRPGSAERVPALLQNVSENGARIVVPDPINVASMVYVEFALRKGRGADAVPATVVWTSDDPARLISNTTGIVAGVKFLIRQWRLPDMMVAAALRDSEPELSGEGPDIATVPPIPRGAVVLLRVSGGKTPPDGTALMVDGSDTEAHAHTEFPLEDGELVHILSSGPSGLRADTVPAVVRRPEPLASRHPAPFDYLTHTASLAPVPARPATPEWMGRGGR